jgi:hypothetical protein
MYNNKMCKDDLIEKIFGRNWDLKHRSSRNDFYNHYTCVILKKWK